MLYCLSSPLAKTVTSLDRCLCELASGVGLSGAKLYNGLINFNIAWYICMSCLGCYREVPIFGTVENIVLLDLLYYSKGYISSQWYVLVILVTVDFKCLDSQ